MARSSWCPEALVSQEDDKTEILHCIGVRGAVSLFDGSNDSSGSSFVFQVLGIALSLTLGLFLANLVVYPNGKKRSVFLGF